MNQYIAHPSALGLQKLVGVTKIVEPEYPILGREIEIKTFMDELMNSMKHQVDRFCCVPANVR